MRCMSRNSLPITLFWTTAQWREEKRRGLWPRTGDQALFKSFFSHFWAQPILLGVSSSAEKAPVVGGDLAAAAPWPVAPNSDYIHPCPFKNSSPAACRSTHCTTTGTVSRIYASRMKFSTYPQTTYDTVERRASRDQTIRTNLPSKKGHAWNLMQQVRKAR